MEHYFIEKEHEKSDYFEISQIFFGKTYFFQSCNDVFSKKEIDYGTYVLINTIQKCEKLFGRILDIGCGNGVIGIVLADQNKNVRFCLSDVNGTAIDLTRQNIIKNNVNNIESVVKSNVYESISGNFDFIITNPPIKAGKSVLMQILLGAFDKLNNGGKLILVIKKKFGEDSTRKKLMELFDSVNILERDNGYYILEAIKKK